LLPSTVDILCQFQGCYSTTGNGSNCHTHHHTAPKRKLHIIVLLLQITIPVHKTWIFIFENYIDLSACALQDIQKTRTRACKNIGDLKKSGKSVCMCNLQKKRIVLHFLEQSDCGPLWGL
jgi:hypothetical protein